MAFCILNKMANLPLKISFSLLVLIQMLIMAIIVYYAVTYVGVIGYIFGSKPESDRNYIRNFFLDVESRKNVGLIVDMPNCQILNISSRDESIEHLFEKLQDFNCDPSNLHWTFVNGTNLVVNETNVIESGYKLEEISCCFKTIARHIPNGGSYGRYIDRHVRFSSKCISIEKAITEMKYEFIQVICKDQKGSFSYEKFHAFAQPLKDKKTRKKVEFWKKIEKPPNILVIGIDALSRQSFTRHMPRTREILEKIGAFEFFGYTKVGDNTFPVAVSQLSGYLVQDLEKICYKSNWTPQDDCPYIWKEFDKMNYYTALVEDKPDIGTFNYRKTGFAKQPTDFYYRTFTVGHQSQFLYQYQGNYKKLERAKCMGYEKLTTNYLNYVKDLIKMSEKSQVPLFLQSWLTTLAHDDLNEAQLGDEEFANFFKFSENLTNTIIIFLSDHGYRHGEIRNTFPGWYEVKLPNFWFKISQDLHHKYPHWSQNLAQNSQKLTSTFDVYHTLIDILRIWTKVKVKNAQSYDGQPIIRKFGQSLISSEISDFRNCFQAGIPDIFCPCSIPQVVQVDNEYLKKSAEKAVDYINSFLPKKKEFCYDLSLKSVYAGAILKNDLTSIEYTVAFISGPGNASFQANVQHFVQNDSFVVNSEVSRISSLFKNCINHSQMELYCFC